MSPPRQHRLFRALLQLVLTAGVVSNCVTAPPDTSAPSPTPLQIETVRRDIATLFRERAAATARGDLSGFQRTFDKTRLALRRCLMDEFEAGSRQGNPDFRFLEVGTLEPYGDYLRAYVNEGSGYQRRYFRRGDGGAWMETEPVNEELGGERTKSIDGLQIEYWGIDEDVIDVMAASAIQARTAVLQNLLGSAAREPFALRFYPTLAAVGIPNCAVGGRALLNTRTDRFMRIYATRFDEAGTAMTAESVALLQHEGLHWAQEQYLPAIMARLPWFLLEGWPDHVAGSTSRAQIEFVVCSTATPTFKQLSDGPPDTPPALFAQYYSFANTMVEYLYLQFGGKDAYARLLTAYKDGVNAEINFPKVLGVTPAQFYDGWIAFAKKKYC